MPGQAPILRISPVPRYMAGVAGVVVGGCRGGSRGGRGLGSWWWCCFLVGVRGGCCPRLAQDRPSAGTTGVQGGIGSGQKMEARGKKTADRTRNCRPWRATDPLTCPFETPWHGALAAAGSSPTGLIGAAPRLPTWGWNPRFQPAPTFHLPLLNTARS